MITFTKFFNWIKIIYGNEVFQFILPFAIALFWGFLSNEKCLYYQASIPQKIESKEMIWKQKIAVYNNGETYIEKQDFAGRENIKLYISGIKKRCHNFNITSNRKPNKLKYHFDSLNSNLILINLIENEVFEINDCFIINLSYYSKEPLKIEITSRIKGVNTGIIENHVSGKEKKVLMASIAILLIYLSIITSRYYLLKKRGIAFHFRPYELFLGGLILGITLLFIYEYQRDFETYEYLNSYFLK